MSAVAVLAVAVGATDAGVHEREARVVTNGSDGVGTARFG